MAVSRPRADQEQRLEIDLGASAPARSEGGIEATLVVAPGQAPRVHLSQLGWGMGVGWYAQRSIDVDLADVQRIAELLGRAQHCAESLDATDQAGPDAEPQDRAPIDLAAARTQKTRSGRRTTRRATGETGRPPVDIACRLGVAREDDAPSER